ncbi:T-cell-specific guanine nucleotide triphosphate-binding protein 1-like [Dendronephthya gigantea]|uniref:T-cell-specific guanine nucleotide triphosphate-binding protein 1-like n=1 Tax=Dendronephthya gigantea TaxID=151771 RepID=UPI00106A313C|nr:T-cell-specific guanine nucleotide triphosphate-binding protein 1-like [Dendronephthya gigantea]
MGTLQTKVATFALVGSSGCGKSAFVNAVRGFDDDDDSKDNEFERIAKVDIVETEDKAEKYIDRDNPLVSFWDPPGYGTPNYFKIRSYWRKFQLERCDIFLIFISHRVTELDLEIIQKVKSTNKPFFLIRTKIDNEYMLEKDRSEFDEEVYLDKVRKYVLEKTNLSSEVFLISNYDPCKWDFFQLLQAMNDVLPVPEMATWHQFFVNRMTRATENFKYKGVEAAQKLMKELNKWKKVKISVAVIGKSGSGKSSFINAIRGVKDDDPNAAKTGVVEMTTIPTPYSYPHNPNITVWDCPGIGAPNIPDVDTFCTKFKIEKFDAFIIMSSTRFTESNAALARKLAEDNKPFFFTRTKIDIDCKNERRKQIKDEETFDKIKAHCLQSLQSAGAPLENNDVFVISSHYPLKWDFGRLTEALKSRLSSRIRAAFLFSMLLFSEDIIKNKVNKLKGRIWIVALRSSFSKGWTELIIVKMNFCRSQLGFPDQNSNLFKELSPRHQEAVQRFCLNSDTDVVSFLQSFYPGDDDGGKPDVNDTTYRFVYRSMEKVLDKMEEIALEILKEAKAQEKLQ